MNSGFLVAALGAVLILFAMIYALRFIYGYRIKDGAIEILLFRVLPIYRISISDIEHIGILPRGSLWISPFVFRLANRLTRNSVLIHRRTGLVRKIVLTPDEPFRFIDQVKAIRAS